MIRSLILFLAATLAHAGDDHEHVIALNDANTLAVEFRVGAAGKTSLEFHFAYRTKQTLLASAQPYKLTRSLLKDGKRKLDMVWPGCW